MFDFPGYNVIGEIGRGGMAIVYRARQVLLDREVALKVLIPSLSQDPVYAQRFLQEARMLASLSHPNIVAVYDVGVTPKGLHYFSMQLVPGGDFALRLANGVDEAELIRVVSAVCDALGFAHARGYVHRDVTPANILFDERNKPVLTDFGIARALAASSRMTASGLSIGTSHYMSPEQARGGEVDRRSDIYSLGVMVFEALTGRPPFDGDDGFAVAYAHVHEPVPQLPAHLSKWQPLIDVAMAKAPEQRYPDTQAFLNAMLRIAGNSSGAQERDESTLIGGRLPGHGVDVPGSSKPSDEDSDRTLIGALPAIRREDIAKAAAASSRAAHPEEKITTPRPAPAVPERPLSDRPTVKSPVVKAPVRKESGQAKPAASERAASSGLQWWHFALAGVVLLGLIALGIGLIMSRNAAQLAGGDVAGAASSSESAGEGSSNPATPQFDPYVPASNSGTTNMESATVEGGAMDASQSAPGGEALIEGDEGSLAAAAATEAGTLSELIYTVIDPVKDLLDKAKANMAAKRYTSPPGHNALERYAQVLKHEPKNKAARDGIQSIAQVFLDMATQTDPESDADKWMSHLDQAESVARTYGLADAEAKAKKMRVDRVEALVKRADAALTNWNAAEAEAAIAAARKVLPSSPAIAAVAKKVGSLGKPGYVFTDPMGKGTGPDMVVIGNYALGRKPVTVGEFRRYWESEGRARFAGKQPACRDRESSFFRSSRDRSWDKPDFSQTDAHPVVCVSAAMADGYVAWLTKISGRPYRLPTAAELTGAGVVYRGDCSANVRDVSYNKEFGSRDYAACDDGFASTSPVNAFAPNNNGLYDAGGNVRQWTACASGTCRDRQAVGASWYSEKDSRNVESFPIDTGFNTIGFRVARDVP